MKEQSDNYNSSQLKLKASRMMQRRKSPTKLSFYETNMENYIRNSKFNIQKIDPKGITANGVFASFSGVIQTAELFSNADENLQISYQISLGQEWHDETPQTNDTDGVSVFCQSKNGKITFSLDFDCLVSCMYILSWPQIVIKVKSFNNFGELVTRGYAQVHLPCEPGMVIKQAYIYSIVKNQKWYHKWLPFTRPECPDYDIKQFERVIMNGEGRQTEKIRCIGVINVKMEVLLRNMSRYGYQ